MRQDPHRQYRHRLLDETFIFQERVDSPWHLLPDHKAYNGRLYRQLARLLKQMELQRQAAQVPQSKGVLLLGEAGMGKTHLLMRLAQTLSSTYHMVFIRKPNNEDAVARHIWINILESMTKPIPRSPHKDLTQLDALLARAFARVLIKELQKDPFTQQKFIQRLIKSPENLFRMFGAGAQRNHNIQLLRRKAQSYFSTHHPEVEQSILDALLRYGFSNEADHKREILQWLKGQEIESDLAAQLGLSASWVEIPAETTHKGVIQTKEEKALQAIRTIGVLSTYYHPLIVAFDQLEGLRDDHNITRRWGDILREIFTMTPNLLVLTCIFPSLWESWFIQELDSSTIDRIAEYQHTLEPLTIESAHNLLRTHLEPVNQRLALPEAIYPFTAEDVARCYQPSMTPRSFLRKARQTLEDWLYDDDDNDEVEVETEVEAEAEAEAEAETSAPDDIETPDMRDLSGYPTPNIQPLQAPPRQTPPIPAWDDFQFDPPPEPLTPAPATHPATLPTSTTPAAPTTLPLETSAIPVPVASTPALSRDKQVDRLIKKQLGKLLQQHQGSYDKGDPNEEDLFGRLRSLTRFLIANHRAPLVFDTHEYNKVLPTHVLLRNKDIPIEDQSGWICCLALCHNNGVAFTSRIQNIARVSSRVLLLRDSRCKAFGNSAQQLLDKLSQRESAYLPVTQDDYCRIRAIDELRTEIEQQDHPLEDGSMLLEREFFAYLHREEFLYQSQILNTLYQYIQGSIAPAQEPPEKPPPTKRHTNESTKETAPLPGAISTPPSEPIAASPTLAEPTKPDTGSIVTPVIQSTAEPVVEPVVEPLVETVVATVVTTIAAPIAAPMLGALTVPVSLPDQTPTPAPLAIPALAPLPTEPPPLRGPAPFATRELQLPAGPPIYLKEVQSAITELAQDPALAAHIAGFSHFQQFYTTDRWKHIPNELISLLQVCFKGAGERNEQNPKTSASSQSLEEIWQRSWGILWAPPGTRSHQAIAEQIIPAMADPAERILLVSPTATGADTIARWLDEQWKNQPHLRLHSRRLANSKDKSDPTSAQMLLDPQVHVLVGALEEVAALLCAQETIELLESGKAPFRTVILAQAHMLPRAATAALGLLASRRIVLVGDPMQLSPLSAPRQHKRILPTCTARWFGESAVGHLLHAKGATQGVAFHAQTPQMHPSLSALIAHYGYQHSPTQHSNTPPEHQPSSQNEQQRAIWYVLDQDAPNTADIRAEQSQAKGGWHRPYTLELGRRVLKSHPQWKAIKGLWLSPFAAQADAAQAWLTQEQLHSWKAGSIHDLHDKTADIVLLDTVHAGSDTWPALEWQRMLNVAISRAQQFVIVFASAQEMQAPYLQALQTHLTPCILKRDPTTEATRWVVVKRPTPIPSPTTLPNEDPATLGHQLSARKLLTPLLNKAQEQICQKAFTPTTHLVQGVTGSGKTLLLARWLCQYLATMPQEHQVRVVCENAFLVTQLQSALQRAWENLQHEHATAAPFPERQVTIRPIMGLLQTIQRELGIKSKAMVGRGEPLDIEIITAECHRSIQKKPGSLPPLCDAMFVDEVQDLGRGTLDLLSFAIRPQHPNQTQSKPLALFYDHAQNIHKRFAPVWSTFGFDPETPHDILDQIFSTTRQIAEFAFNVMYALRPPSQDADKKFIQQGLLKKATHIQQPWWEYHGASLHGPIPEIKLYEKLLDQMEGIGDYIIDCIGRDKVRPIDIKILCPTQEESRSNAIPLQTRLTGFLTTRLDAINVKISVLKNDQMPDQDDVIFATTPEHFKGHFAEIVIIAGVDLFITEDTTEEEPQIEARVEALHIAMTRARTKLLICGSDHQSPKELGQRRTKFLDTLQQCRQTLLARETNQYKGSKTIEDAAIHTKQTLTKQ